MKTKQPKGPSRLQPQHIHTILTNKYVKELGNHALNTTELNNMGKHLFRSKYLGTVPQDNVTFGKSGYMIVNTDTSKGKGKHWVALYITPKTVYVYDSYGRKTSTLLKVLTRQAKLRKIKLVDSRRDAEQANNTVVCGHMSLAWLTVVKMMGIRQALKI
jgi:hypothetical protein